MVPPLRVEWASMPEEWMMDAALAFDACLHHCQPPKDEDSKDAYVVSISVFRESCRPADRFGRPLPPVPFGHMEVVAQPMVRRLRSQPLVWTRFGQFLYRHQCLGKCIALLACMIAAVHVVGPGLQKFEMRDPFDNNRWIDVTKPHAVTMLVNVILLVSCLLLVAHQTSKDLVKICISTFDAAVIAFSAATANFVFSYEMFNHASLVTEVMQVDVILAPFQAVAITAAHISVAVMDAWTVSPTAKLAVTASFTLSCLYSYLHHRYNVRWSSQPVCWIPFESCSTMQGVYLGALSNEIIFGLKLCVPFLRQRTYGLLRSSSIDPTRERFENGRVRSTREGMFDQGHRFSNTDNRCTSSMASHASSSIQTSHGCSSQIAASEGNGDREVPVRVQSVETHDNNLMACETLRLAVDNGTSNCHVEAAPSKSLTQCSSTTSPDDDCDDVDTEVGPALQSMNTTSAASQGVSRKMA